MENEVDYPKLKKTENEFLNEKDIENIQGTLSYDDKLKLDKMIKPLKDEKEIYRKRKNAIESFSYFDKNNNGLIKETEFKKILTLMGINKNEKIEYFLERASYEGNGFINYIEFVNFMLPLISEIKEKINIENDPNDLKDLNYIINPEMPKVNKNEIITSKVDLNPEGPNSEIYKKQILKGQKILIVMTYQGPSCNIEKLFKNEDNKTLKEAANHFGIGLVTVNNYDDAINEITKEENGKCPYYACWIINSDYERSKTKEFLELLAIFWINGGAVVLFSDNAPFIIETNIFLSMISLWMAIILDKKKFMEMIQVYY